MAATYWWHDYVFAASGVLWIQVCAQNWAMYQTGFADDDDMRISINGIIPSDYDGIQNGLPNPGGFAPRPGRSERAPGRSRDLEFDHGHGRAKAACHRRTEAEDSRR
jgi:hypothetical protein